MAIFWSSTGNSTRLMTKAIPARKYTGIFWPPQKGAIMNRPLTLVITSKNSAA